MSRKFSSGIKDIKRLLQLIAAMVFLGNFVFAQTPTAAAQNNGTISENEPCAANPAGTFDQYVEASKKAYAEEVGFAKREGFTMENPANLSKYLLSKNEFERRKKYEGFECRRIKYLSDGLRIVGYIWKPKNANGKKLPVIIYNRGGNREQGKNTPWMREGFYYFLEQGFVIIGSQYRSNDGGEGQEEFGGADVNDILNLVPLAKSLGYADMNNVFMFGHSRGGMMTYLALKNNVAVNAAATGGGLADLVTGIDNRPELIANVYRQLIPEFDTRRDELARARSATHFADKINTPLLILQGNADWRAETGNQALALAQKLQSFGKTYELIVYAKDDHRLTLNRLDSERRIVEWFKKYMK